jgi:hypothetical protein
MGVRQVTCRVELTTAFGQTTAATGIGSITVRWEALRSAVAQALVAADPLNTLE